MTTSVNGTSDTSTDVAVVPDEELSVDPKTDLDAKDKPKKPEYDPDWEHERIEFYGDDLAIRIPTQQALSAFQLSSSKYVSSEKQGNVSGMFVDRHLGPDTYDRVMERLMDPDDTEYTTSTVAELMGKLVSMSVEKIKADMAAQLEAAK